MGIGTPVALLIGMLLVLGSVGLFFFDKFKPAYARESDKVYAAFILVAGLVTLVNWGMDAGPSFLMFLMSGMLTTLLIENVRNREPRIVDPLSPLDKRPPDPRYNARPPVRRGYRAEIDREPYRERPVDLPDRRPNRMNPAPEAAWRNDYADSRSLPRQPYEEYREPAGRLQPSGADRPAADRPLGNRPQNDRPQNDRPQNDRPQNDRPQNDRYAADSGSAPGRYGDRPPARPPANRSSQRPPDRFAEGSGYGSSNSFQARPAEDRSAWPDERGLERGLGGGSARRPEGSSDRVGGSSDSDIDRSSGWAKDSRDRPPAVRDNRPANADRALNVRPYSEAPKIDLPKENGYRPTDADIPEGTPSES